MTGQGQVLPGTFRFADHMSTTAPIAFQIAMTVGQADTGAASSGVTLLVIRNLLEKLRSLRVVDRPLRWSVAGMPRLPRKMKDVVVILPILVPRPRLSYVILIFEVNDQLVFMAGFGGWKISSINEGKNQFC